MKLYAYKQHCKLAGCVFEEFDLRVADNNDLWLVAEGTADQIRLEFEQELERLDQLQYNSKVAYDMMIARNVLSRV